jgi:uncharacterized protein
MEDTPKPKPNRPDNNSRTDVRKSTQKKKRTRLPQGLRVQIAYLLLTVIAVALFTLLILLPHGGEAGPVRSAPGREGRGDPVAGAPPGYSPEKKQIEKTKPVQERPDSPEPEVPPEEPRGAEQEPEQEPEQQKVAVHPLGTIEPAPAGAGILYLVIDDVGYNLEQLNTYLQLPIPMTFALLPGLEYSRAAQDRIAAEGAEMILHQPIEPVGDQDPGPGALYVGMPPEEMRRIINRNLEQLPKVIGVNNHMGSRGTADTQLMQALFSVLKGRNLFFLDSRTTAETVAPAVARQTGLQFSQRNVFLDNIEEQIEIEKALASALEVSRAQGYAVMIGHVWSRELASTLALWYAEIEERGYRFARISSFFAEEHVHAGNGN